MYTAQHQVKPRQQDRTSANKPEQHYHVSKQSCGYILAIPAIFVWQLSKSEFAMS